VCFEKTSLISFITKYKPEKDSWEDVISFDLRGREEICVVASEKLIYFLRGFYEDWHKTFKNTDRFDLKANTWDKIGDLQEPRRDAYGAAV